GRPEPPLPAPPAAPLRATAGHARRRPSDDSLLRMPMRRPMKPTLRPSASVLLLLVALLSVAPTRAHADARTDARNHFRNGMDLVSGGDIDAGVAELELAYEI